MIRQNASLRARIARLEQRQVRFDFPRLVFRIYPFQAGEIVGFNVGNLYVARLAGETEAELIERTFLLSPSSPCIFAVHAERAEDAAEAGDSASPSHAPAEQSGALGGSEIDLAGIGRRATAEELWNAGWTRGPAERPR